MNKKYWIAAFLFLITAAVSCLAVWHYSLLQNEDFVRGEFAFSKTRTNLRAVSRIQMISQENGEINLYRKNGLWYFQEAKNYFVNVERLADFFRMVNETVVKQDIDLQTDELRQKALDAENGTIVRTYDVDGKLFDALVIGKRAGKDSVWMRAEKNKHHAYLIGPVEMISGHPMDWIPYPLLAIEHNMIDWLHVRKHTLNRAKLEEQIIRSPTMRRFILALQYLDYVGLVYKNELLDDKTLEIERKSMEIGMIDGLVYRLEIYKVGDSYWLGVELGADKISRIGVKDFIAQNQKYFADWLFQLSNEQGKMLFDL